MSRPKGSKNKTKLDKGNPKFNLNDAEPVVDWQDAAAAITEEDRALDRELEMMARTEAPSISDTVEPEPLKKNKEHYILLSEVIDDYKPATTLMELDEQVQTAKLNECDSVEASETIVKYFTKAGYQETKKVGYFWYKDIRVYIAGIFEQSKVRDAETIEHRTFGASQIK